MNDEPTFHTARRRLQLERARYNRPNVRQTPDDGFGVYAIWVGYYDCLYIGKSEVSVKERLLFHLSRQEDNSCLRRGLRSARDYAEFSICLTNSAEWADALETLLIQDLQPQCNRYKLGPTDSRIATP